MKYIVSWIFVFLLSVAITTMAFPLLPLEKPGASVSAFEKPSYMDFYLPCTFCHNKGNFIGSKQSEPERKKPESERKKSEPERKQPEPEKKQPEPERKQPEPESKQPEPERKQPEPERKQSEPERKQPEPEKKQPEPERKQPEPEKNEPEYDYDNKKTAEKDSCGKCNCCNN